MSHSTFVINIIAEINYDILKTKCNHQVLLKTVCEKDFHT